VIRFLLAMFVPLAAIGAATGAPVMADSPPTVEASVSPGVGPIIEHPTGCRVTWYNSWPQAGSAGPCSYFQGSLAVVVFCTDAWGNGANYYGPRVYTNTVSARTCPWTRPNNTFVGTSRTGH
jgi:hypothetical protein